MRKRGIEELKRKLVESAMEEKGKKRERKEENEIDREGKNGAKNKRIRKENRT